MKAETIKAIFTNLLFVIGVILIIFGFTNSALTISRIVTFDKYPLHSYEEGRCELEFSRPAYVSTEESIAQLSDEELATRKERCDASLEQQREVKKVEDIVTSVSVLLAGTFLALTFKRFILK